MAKGQPSKEGQSFPARGEAGKVSRSSPEDAGMRKAQRRRLPGTHPCTGTASPGRCLATGANHSSCSPGHPARRPDPAHLVLCGLCRASSAPSGMRSVCADSRETAWTCRADWPCMRYGRAVCGESRTYGSEGGGRKRAAGRPACGTSSPPHPIAFSG
jgi:hypothetical protein